MTDIIRLQYEHKFDKFKLGAILIVNSDDGDPSIISGLVFGVDIN